MKKVFFTVGLGFLCLLEACSLGGPVPFRLGKEACSYCSMTIIDPHFGAEIITGKGKVYKFDDIACFNSFLKEGRIAKEAIKHVYTVNYCENHNLIKVDEHLLLYKTNLLHSPMNGNIAAFESRDSLAVVMKAYPGGMPLNWDELIK
jgi:copper chaperone NosL